MDVMLAAVLGLALGWGATRMHPAVGARGIVGALSGVVGGLGGGLIGQAWLGPMLAPSLAGQELAGAAAGGAIGGLVLGLVLGAASVVVRRRLAISRAPGAPRATGSTD